jgi:hypothetical protein
MEAIRRVIPHITYITRSKRGITVGYMELPIRSSEYWKSQSTIGYGYRISDALLSSLTWDDEPINIRDELRKAGRL